MDNIDFLNFPENNTRLGFHYFPDTTHFRESDLLTWIPELHALGASWLVLQAPIDRAIPEFFLHNLQMAGIEPILHFQTNLSSPPDLAEITMLLNAYAKWGIHFVIFFDRPNSRLAWPASTWTQEDLVERFLDRYLPFSELAIKAGLTPVFPPLEPGGHYWDTAFLNSTFQSLIRRKKQPLLDQLVLSAYSWTNEHSLNWGAGGPERWPGAHPYFTPEGEEDQCGFRIFDWYQATCKSVIQHTCPIILLGAGCAWDPSQAPGQPSNPVVHAQTNFNIARLALGETVNDPIKPEVLLELVPPEVIACNFWLLSASSNSPYLSHSWIHPEGQTMPVVGTIRQWYSRFGQEQPVMKKALTIPNPHAINHYLLLPVYEWGVADWHLDAIRPYIKKYTPTVGFSLAEASHAIKVTVIGNENNYSNDDLEILRNSGCSVERISGDGTSIATQLAER